MLQRIVQLRSRNDSFAGTDRRQAAFLVKLAPQEKLVGIYAVAPSDHRDALSGFQTFAHHGQLLLGTPAPPALLAKQFAATLIVTVSHKHTRLPTPYPKGETGSCLSRGSFSFVYEDKVVPPRDVDCSFQSEGYKFNVEVKCADYTSKHKIDSEGDFIIRGIGRLSDYRNLTAQLQETFASGGKTLASGLHMDNKLKEFLYDAHGKFPDATAQDQYNVLVVGCDDPWDMQQWEGYLTGQQGLFSHNSFADVSRYDNVDLVVLTNLYHRHKSVAEKDKLTDHWTFANAFSLLYENPRSKKPRSMLYEFSRTLRFYNNELFAHKMEGDAPEFLKERLAISHYVGHMQWAKGQYTFQPKSGKQRNSDQKAN